MFINFLTSLTASAKVLRDRGAVAGEYAVLLALIAVAIVAAIGFLSTAISGALSTAASVITN